MENNGLNMEECAGRLAVSLEKLQYLLRSINQKFEKCAIGMTVQEKEAFIYERDDMRIHLDIAEDYVHEAACIVDGMMKGLRHEETGCCRHGEGDGVNG